MTEPTLKKTHELLERLAEHVMNKLPTREEMNTKLEQKADKKDVDKLLEGQDRIVKELEIMRTDQVAFNHGFNKLEKRVEKLEKTAH